MTHWAVTKIQRNCSRCKVLRYQLLQRVRTKDKVRCMSFRDILSKLEDDGRNFIAKTVFSVKATTICTGGMLTEIMLKLGLAAILLQGFDVKRPVPSLTSFVVYTRTNTMYWAIMLSFFARSTVSGVVNIDMPKEWIPHTECGRS
jgi:hypothetical protein